LLAQAGQVPGEGEVEMAIADAWMTWAARPDELALPVGLTRLREPDPRTGCVDRLASFTEDASTTYGVETTDGDGDGDDDGDGDGDGLLSAPDCGDIGAAAKPAEETFVAVPDSRGERRAATTHSDRRRRSRPAARMLGLVAASGVAAGGVLVTPGCETIAPVAIQAAISVCIELVKSLFDAPADQLPAGYVPCDTLDWQVHGHELKFCLFCNPAVESEVFVQFQCTGKYYPMRLRRLAQTETLDTVEGISIKSIECDERFLIDVRSTVDPFMSAVSCTLEVPSGRTMPSIGHYGALDVRVDGVPAPRRGDFAVDAACTIELDGAFDDVAHYAMTCGIRELAFKDGDNLWSVHANPAVSAIAVFRNDVLYDARFLFAPMPPGGFGY
jgi:hypothetical protein